jgi:uncharacterized protein YukE
MTTPIGASSNLFPEREAQIVIEWAEKAGQAAIRGTIDMIRDWLGHPEEVKRIARVWSDASRPIGRAGDGVHTALADLKVYWAGTAFEAFNGQMERVSGTIIETQNMLTEQANAIMALRSHITDTYNAAIGFIGECAAIIAENTSGFLAEAGANILQAVGQLPAAVSQALADFIRNVIDLQTTAMTTATKYGQDIFAIAARTSALRPPDDAPRAIGEPDSWNVNAANR